MMMTMMTMMDDDDDDDDERQAFVCTGQDDLGGEERSQQGRMRVRSSVHEFAVGWW